MPLPTLDPTQWGLALLAALLIGLSKAGFGGVGMLAVILMAQVLPARESTGAVLPLLILADIFAVYSFHQHADFRVIFRLLVPSLIGVVSGWLLMPYLSADIFAPVIGWITLSLLLLFLGQKSVPALKTLAAGHPVISSFFGWLAGVTTMIANAAGPVTTIYLLACRLPKMIFVGTGAWYFFIVNVLKVPFSVSLGLINVQSLSLNLWLAPLVVIGIFCGRRLLHHVNQSVFEWLMIVFSLLGALRLILA